MNSIATPIGIDVSKATLQVSCAGQKSFRVSNDESGIRELIQQLPEGACVHLESSGGYERRVRRLMGQAGIVCHVHNARKIERMADGLGRSAKNDDLDARHLCQAGPLVKSFPAKSAEQEALCDLSRTIRFLKAEVANFKKRASAAELDVRCVRALAHAARKVTAEIAQLEKRHLQAIQVSKHLTSFELALSVPCIGQTTAALLVSELPANLLDAPVKQMLSYAGLAPKDDDSGQRQGARHIQKGNLHLKSALYMPAVTAVAYQDWARRLYQRLRAKGRCHQEAIVAIMRKLLERVIVVLQRGTPYQDVPPQLTHSKGTLTI